MVEVSRLRRAAAEPADRRSVRRIDRMLDRERGTHT
jgi:hypothetical protein